jgi:hypothetical protein
MPTKTDNSPQESNPIDAAEGLIKEAVRNTPFVPFHREAIASRCDASRLPGIIGLDSPSKEKLRAVFAGAIANATKSCPGLKIELQETAEHEISGFSLTLDGTTEWSDVIRYAHGAAGDEALTRLSEPAEDLLGRIESGELDDFVKELSIRHRLRFFGWNSRFEVLAREIRLKRGIEVQIESKGQKYHQRQHLMKFSIVGRHPRDEARPALNPVLPKELHDSSEHRAFIRWFLQLLVESPFEGPERKNIWYITTRAEYFRCFPKLRDTGKVSDTVAELLRVLQPLPYFKIGWNFDDEAVHWFVVIAPQGTWEDTKRTIADELAGPTSEKKYGLSPAAASLFDWIRRLDESSLEYGLTPVVEDAMENHALPLKSPWSSENFTTFITLLCEEVTERTPYDLRPMPWHQQYSEKATRIRVRGHPEAKG